MRYVHDLSRAERRLDTHLHGLRQLRIRRAAVRGHDGWADATPHWFARCAALGCSCRGRVRGRPKVGQGCCRGMGALRRAVLERMRGKEICRRWARGGEAA